MGEFIKVAEMNDLEEGQVVRVDANGVEVALIKHGGKFFALDNTCVHMGGPLGEGVLEDANVVCPWHGWRYDVRTGRCINMPNAHVKAYEVKVEGKDVLVKVS